MTTYTCLAADLSPALEGHQIVRVEHELLAKPMFVTAHFAPKPLTKSEAKAWAESLSIGGLSWRLPIVEEGSFIPDRTIYPCFNSKVFIGARNSYPAIWTDTPDPEDPASCSFVVGLGLGYVDRYRHGNQCRALAVRAGQ